MIESHKEFFQKLSKLCEEYAVTILDSGSVRKGIEVTFYDDVESPELREIVYEKFSAELMFLKVTDQDGNEHLYK